MLVFVLISGLFTLMKQAQTQQKEKVPFSRSCTYVCAYFTSANQALTPDLFFVLFVLLPFVLSLTLTPSCPVYWTLGVKELNFQFFCFFWMNY